MSYSLNWGVTVKFICLTSACGYRASPFGEPSGFIAKAEAVEACARIPLRGQDIAVIPLQNDSTITRTLIVALIRRICAILSPAILNPRSIFWQYSTFDVWQKIAKLNGFGAAVNPFATPKRPSLVFFWISTGTAISSCFSHSLGVSYRRT
jgi:hypothetical protein